MTLFDFFGKEEDGSEEPEGEDAPAADARHDRPVPGVLPSHSPGLAENCSVPSSLENLTVEEEYGSVPSSLRSEDGYVLGVDPRNQSPRVLPGEQRIHSLIVGKSGAGKSTLILSQMLQDIENGGSVVLVDPHGDLAKQFLTHIPEDRWEDVVYVNPLTARDMGRVVKFNFLEPVPGTGRDLAKRAFASVLKKVYGKFWGPRLDSIMRHSLNLLFETVEFPTVQELGKIMPNRGGFRDDLLEDCQDKETMDFWEHDYDDFLDEYYISAQNKIYKMLCEDVLVPMTSTKHSTVNLYEAMNEGKILVVDLPSGRLADVADFLGSVFLARIYQVGMAREGLPKGERLPVHVYVDEAHRFIAEIIRDNMRTLRKFGIFITAASQNLNEYEEEARNELPELVDTVLAFRCGEDTARSVQPSFPTLGKGEDRDPWESIKDLPLYHFYLSTLVGGHTEVRFAETIDVGRGAHDPDEVIAKSLDEHGGEPRELKEAQGKVPIPSSRKYNPAEYLALSMLAKAYKKKESIRGPEEDDSIDWRIKKDALVDEMGDRYGFESTEIYSALNRLDGEGVIGWAYKQRTAGGQGAKTSYKFFHITEDGLDFIYPRFWGPRMGGEKHVTMICLLMRHFREKRNCYTLPVTGNTKGIQVTLNDRLEEAKESGYIDVYPDIIAFPPLKSGSGKITPKRWNPPDAFAIEVEAYPTGSETTGSHLERTATHFENARDKLELPVLFAVSSEEEKESVEDRLVEAEANLVDDIIGASPGDAKVMVLDMELPPEDELKKQIRDCAQMIDESDIPEEAEPEDSVAPSGETPVVEKESVKKIPTIEKPDSMEEGEVEPIDEGDKEQKNSGREKEEEPSQGVEAEVGEEENPSENISGGEDGGQKWKGKEELSDEDWRSLVKIYRKRRMEDEPSEKLAEVLWELKERGCVFGADDDKYLQIRKYEDNKRKTKSGKTINKKVEKAMEMAEIDI